MWSKTAIGHRQRQQPDHDLGEQRQPHVERRQRELRPGLRLDAISPRTASAGRSRIRTSARTTPAPPAMPTMCSAASAPATTTGISATEVQHQLRPGVSVTGGYYRNWAGNFRVDRQPGGDARGLQSVLHHGAGRSAAARRRRLPGLRPVRHHAGEVRPGRTTWSRRRRTITGRGPGHLRHTAVRGSLGANGVCGTSDFFSVSVNARFGSGIRLGGGVDTGRTVTDNCFVVDSPQQLLNCHVVTPFKAQTQVKLNGSYPLPGDFVVSGTFQNLSGPPIEANYPATNAEIAPSLGRNLAACGHGPGPRAPRRPRFRWSHRMTQFGPAHAARPAADESPAAGFKGPPAGECRPLQRAQRQYRFGGQQHVRPTLARTRASGRGRCDSAGPPVPVRWPAHLLVYFAVKKRLRRR